MRFCKIENNTVTNIIKAEQGFVDSLPCTYIQDDKARLGWILEDGVFVNPIKPYIPTFDENKQAKIKELQNKYQAEYDAYLSKYPKREVESFDDKKKEALAYNTDNSASTPLVDAMVGGDANLRIEMLNAILTKVLYIAAQEGIMVATRDAIKACTTQDDLDAIEI